VRWNFAIAAEKNCSIPGARDWVICGRWKSEVSVKVDRDKMAALGFEDYKPFVWLNHLTFSGNTDGRFRAGEYEYDINIKT
jgi:HAE1 family hydrophobic/amphiphilic exporter-1